MKITMRKILFVLLLAAFNTIEAAHITDKLLVGFYEEPDEATQPSRVLPSGTPVEVIKKEGAFSQVRLSDSSVGWIKTNYITNEKPAKAMVLELQAKTADLQEKLKKTEQELKAARAAAASGGGEVQKLKQELAQVREQLAQANDKIEELQKADMPVDEKVAALEKELDVAAEALEESKTESMLLRDQLKMLTGEAAAGKVGEARIVDLETRLATALKALEESKKSDSAKESELLRVQQANRALWERITEAAELLGTAEKMEPPEPVTEEGSSWWYLLLSLLALGGFVIGVAFKDYLVRRRYGGFRI